MSQDLSANPFAALFAAPEQAVAFSVEAHATTERNVAMDDKLNETTEGNYY